MAYPPDTRLGIGRRFAIEIAVACLVIATLLWRRGAPSGAPLLLVAAAAVLVALAIWRPTLVAPLARRWLGVSERIAHVTTPIFLTVIYLLVLTPLGFLRRHVARSPIRRDRRATTFWVEREPVSTADARAAMEHQF